MSDQDTQDEAAGFPAWQGPLVAGAIFGILALVNDHAKWEVSGAAWFAGHIMVGATIGLLVSLCDGPGPGTLTSRFLALISVVTALLPVFGLPFNVAAFWTNRHYPGFHRTVSRVTLGIGVLFSVLVLIVMSLAAVIGR
jgi:lysylphosphatidylglycerol synthetase-like protein (DUF2156 family)